MKKFFLAITLLTMFTLTTSYVVAQTTQIVTIIVTVVKVVVVSVGNNATQTSTSLSTVTSTTSTIIGFNQTANWAALHGIEYRSSLLDYTCYQKLPACDNPNVAVPNQAFPVYHQNGFNFARISPMSWRYAEQNLSGIEGIWSQFASACDLNGIYCDYHFGTAGPNIPLDVTNAWGIGNFQAHFVNNSIIPIGSGTPYDGKPVWQALFNGLFKPLIQTVDSHPSTVAYGLLNEPNAPFNWNTVSLHNYYEYMTQQIRALSTKAVTFQANGGGGGSGTIGQLAPTIDLKPYVFEIHNYQGVLNSNPYPQACLDARNAGAAGCFLGEWGFSQVISPYSNMTQEIDDELQAIKTSQMANGWFDYSGLTTPPSASLNANGMLLSQETAKILG